LRKEKTNSIDTEIPLVPWNKENVGNFISHYINVPDAVKRCFPLLVGRARITIIFLENFYRELQFFKEKYIRTNSNTGQLYLDWNSLVLTVIHLVQEEFITLLDPEYRKTMIDVVDQGVLVTKGDVFRKILLYGKKFHWIQLLVIGYLVYFSF